MYHLYSVIDGFKVTLGSLPLQLGMLLTLLIMVPVPKIDGHFDWDAMFYKLYLVFVHAVLFLQITINHYYAMEIPMLSASTNVVLMCLQVFTQIKTSVNWIFTDHDQAWHDAR